MKIEKSYSKRNGHDQQHHLFCHISLPASCSSIYPNPHSLQLFFTTLLFVQQLSQYATFLCTPSLLSVSNQNLCKDCQEPAQVIPYHSTLLRKWNHAVVQKQKRKPNPNIIFPQYILGKKKALMTVIQRQSLGEHFFPSMEPEPPTGQALKQSSFEHTYHLEKKRKRLSHSSTATDTRFGTRVLPFNLQLPANPSKPQFRS